ncbi:MAG: hypothetical protein K2K90_16870 [Lachnospiraceae bacterium]|nr:hypothetical protein [Lachnospiraceae bacterium]
MSKVTMNERREEDGNGKRQIHVNFGLLAGMIGGAILGVFIGAVAKDIPLYTGFGMILGMAISIDLAAHIKRKNEKTRETGEMRE